MSFIAPLGYVTLAFLVMAGALAINEVRLLTARAKDPQKAKAYALWQLEVELFELNEEKQKAPKQFGAMDAFRIECLQAEYAKALAASV